MHTINQKEIGHDCARTTISDNLIELDNNAREIITRRLIDAAGKNTRAFELEISNHVPGSFYDMTSTLKGVTDDEFIQVSKDIAELLAESQKNRSIPGGYLIIIDCVDNDGKFVFIVIKAEPHEALRLEDNSQIKLLEQVFLSPSQKLYKIGILFEKNLELEAVNGKFGALLFDCQFRQDGHPAEYFYRDFLGFSTSRNSKIQTLQFYKKTSEFILDKISDPGKKQELLSALKVMTKSNVSPLLKPSDFADDYLEGETRDAFIRDVANNLPSSFTKDIVLITSQLNKRKLWFSNKINLVGPEDKFDDSVRIIRSKAQFEALELNDPDYSIIVVKGKPFTNEQ